MKKLRDQTAPKKSLGQHFLCNRGIAKRMVEAAGVGTGDTVLEIGPGKGFLTRAILDSGAFVIAVETDARMAKELRSHFKKEMASGRLHIHEADVRETDPTALGLRDKQYTVVANIPYFLTGFLFRHFLSARVQPACLVFLVQKEIAERIARDTKSSLLSLSVRAYGAPEYIQTVRPGSFTPPPHVDSAIIAVRGISRERFEQVNEPFFFELLHLGFSARRKQLLGSLVKRFDRNTLVHIFSTLDIPEDVRGEDLSLEKWLGLACALEMHR